MRDSIDRLVETMASYLTAHSGPGIAEMRAALAATRGETKRTITPSPSEVCERHLSAALAALTSDGFADLAEAIAAAAPGLAWITYDAYPRNEIGDFAGQHAFASLIGSDAPFDGKDFDLGLFLISPNIFYRDHHHAAPELYIPLTGPHGWRFKLTAPFVNKPAHEPVWNPPWQPHATRVGEIPFLCLFAWLKDVDQPAKVCTA
jgi:hypothetical protein